MRGKKLLSAVAVAALTVGVAGAGGAAAGSGAAEQARPEASSYAGLSNQELWRRIGASGGEAVVGLKAPGQTRGVSQGRVLISDAERELAEAKVRSVPGVRVLAEQAPLPVVKVELADAGTVAKLRRLRAVDYLEPVKSPVVLASAAGCFGWGEQYRGGTPYSGPYVGDTYGDLLPWNFDNHKIRDAWSRGPNGSGVTIGVVDTGVFREQRELNEEFATGQSAGRSITQLNYSSSSNPYDECNHGTRMVSTAAGPRNGRDLVGVAWKSHVVSAKAQNDVVLDSGDSWYVANAISGAAWRSKIVAMAFGHPFDAPTVVADTIRYHHNRGVLFIAAAGTKPSWVGCGVIFPARMPEVVAVTGVKPDGGVHPEACSGPEVDVAAVVGGWDPKVDVPASGVYQGLPINFGGTSDGTAVVAGIAALVWSEKPTWSRDQIVDRLYASGWGYRDSQRGYGVVDAYRAVGGFSGLSISGPSRVVPGTTYTLTARSFGDGPFAYRWSTGETTASITKTAGTNGTSQTFSVTVTDSRENKSLSASKNVTAFEDDGEVDPCVKVCP